LFALSGDHFLSKQFKAQWRFSMVDSPLVQKNSSGVSLSSNKIIGSYSSAPNSTYTFDELHALGDADLVVDSKRAAEFSKTFPPTSSRTELQSDTVDVDKRGEVATVELKAAFRLDDQEHTIPKQGTTDRVTVIHGSSGTFQISLPKKPNRAKLITGDANGPVHFHSVETVQEPVSIILFGHVAAFTRPTERTSDVVGDHLTIDMRKDADQIVLEGHIKWSYSVNGAHGVAKRFLATVDDKGNITSWGIEGVPDPVLPPGAKS
jgi:hypothetical protein